MSGRFGGKVVFITGVARGQGRAHALRFASEGADVIGVDVAGPLHKAVPYESATMDDLDQTRADVEKLGRRALFSQVDVRDLDLLRDTVDAGVTELGRLDAVIANAGICIPVNWDDTSPEVFDETMAVNVRGAWNTVMVTAPHVIAAGGGSITLISSSAGKKIQPFMIPYATSKHAITGMTRAFAAELGRHEIRVNSIHPGGVATPMGGGGMTDTIHTATAAHPKLGQMGQTFTNRKHSEPEEIAALAAYLASDDARMITSEHLSIDGGVQHF